MSLFSLVLEMIITLAIFHFASLGMLKTYNEYKPSTWSTYRPSRTPKTMEEKQLFRAANNAKQALARFIVISDPQDKNHDRAVSMMSCFIEVDYVYNETLLESPNGKKVSAYVYVSKFTTRKRIYFLNLFFIIPLSSQTHTILHECSHLYHDTKDHAYVQDYHYSFLHQEEEGTNADSFVDSIMNKNILAKHEEIYRWNRLPRLRHNSQWRSMRGRS